jgi:hypothetical protein
MSCTHGGELMNITPGATCPWCAETVAERSHSLATTAGRVEASPASPLPAAPIVSAPTAASVPSVLPAGQSVSDFPPARRAGADTNKHARNTDPDTAHDAALSVNDAHKRRLYDHILALIFEHGPLTDWQLSRFLTARIGEPVIATSAGKRRGELRDMGLLYDTGFRGPTETGPKKAVRWGLTPAGEQEVAA